MDYRIYYKELDAVEDIEPIIIGDPNDSFGDRVRIGYITYGTRPLSRSSIDDKDVLQSVIKNGVRNPPLVFSSGDCNYIVYGGTRIWASALAKKKVPCIIADYSGRYEGEEELFTEDDVRSKFTDMPSIVQIGHKRMNIYGLPCSI